MTSLVNWVTYSDSNEMSSHFDGVKLPLWLWKVNGWKSKQFAYWIIATVHLYRSSVIDLRHVFLNIWINFMHVFWVYKI
jgi:hypothetical protein